MSRIFTFGCSLTEYAWPTWAVIMSYDLKIPVYNFAKPGMGNVGIHHMIIYADMLYNFTKDDKMLILWSSWSREDRIKNKKWNNSGSVFSETYYDRRFLKTHWDMDNDVVKNSSAIISVNTMYADIIAWQGSWAPLFTPEDDKVYKNKSKKIIELYERALPKMEIHALDGVEVAFSGLVRDSHPDVNRHLQFTKDFIMPSLGKTIDIDTETRFKQIHNDIEQLVTGFSKTNRGSLEYCQKEIMKFINLNPDIRKYIIHEDMDRFLQDLDNL
jgi:hypothetical protein